MQYLKILKVKLHGYSPWHLYFRNPRFLTPANGRVFSSTGKPKFSRPLSSNSHQTSQTEWSSANWAKDKTEFYIILVLAILSWLITDPLPFVDEIVFAYLTIVKFKQLSSQ